MMNKLKGKRVLITGAAKGIGFETALCFAKAGCELVLVDIDGQALEKTHNALSIHTKVISECRNICDQDQMNALADIVIASGGLDILINNAGIGHAGEIKDITMATWKHLFDVNLFGPLTVFYAFLPHFMGKKDGHIVNVCSGQKWFELPTWGAYTASKSALSVFSQVSKYELAKYGIKVSTVFPFMVRTGFYDNVRPETSGSQLAMKLLPYYSNNQKTVGKKIFDAVKHNKSVEMVNPINYVGKYIHSVPYLHSMISKIAFKVLGK